MITPRARALPGARRSPHVRVHPPVCGDHPTCACTHLSLARVRVVGMWRAPHRTRSVGLLCGPVGRVVQLSPALRGTGECSTAVGVGATGAVDASTVAVVMV